MTTLEIILGIALVLVIAAVIYFRRPNVATPEAIKAIEDRAREQYDKLADRVHELARSAPPPNTPATPPVAPPVVVVVQPPAPPATPVTPAVPTPPAPMPPAPVPSAVYEDWVDGFGPKNGAPRWVIDRWFAERLRSPDVAPTPPAPPPTATRYEEWVDAFGPKNGAPQWVTDRWMKEHGG